MVCNSSPQSKIPTVTLATMQFGVLDRTIRNSLCTKWDHRSKDSSGQYNISNRQPWRFVYRGMRLAQKSGPNNVLLVTQSINAYPRSNAVQYSSIATERSPGIVRWIASCHDLRTTRPKRVSRIPSTHICHMKRSHGQLSHCCITPVEEQSNKGWFGRFSSFR